MVEARIKQYKREAKLALTLEPSALGSERFPLPEDMGVIHAHIGATIEDCLTGKYKPEEK